MLHRYVVRLGRSFLSLGEHRGSHKAVESKDELNRFLDTYFPHPIRFRQVWCSSQVVVHRNADCAQSTALKVFQACRLCFGMSACRGCLIYARALDIRNTRKQALVCMVLVSYSRTGDSFDGSRVGREACSQISRMSKLCASQALERIGTEVCVAWPKLGV